MIRVEPVRSIALNRSGHGWPFARDNQAAIERHWIETKAAKPGLWNGKVLLCVRAEVADRHLDAELVEADYASFIAWRDWGMPDKTVRNCFGVAAAFSSDGALVFGVMAGWTLNAGKAYPPSGTLEPKDLKPDGTVDLHGNMRTEFEEEVGLDLGMARRGDMAAIFEGQRLAIVQRHDFDLDFAGFKQAFAAHKKTDPNPELERIEAIRDRSQIDARMPLYAQEIIRLFLS